MTDIAELERAAGLVGLANGIEKSLASFGHVTLSNDDWQDICASLRVAAAHGEAGWQDISKAPKDGTRVNLCWEAGALPAHVELGKWNGRAGWCNTYGHPYSADPDYWQALPVPPVTRHQSGGAT